jgi:hypothetical protein
VAFLTGRRAYTGAMAQDPAADTKKMLQAAQAVVAAGARTRDP